MASRRTQLTSTAVMMAVAMGGYGLYLATAQSVPPDLSQTPMNITNVIPPAFVMAVDDSGSMTFETLFPGQDGQGCWNTGSSNPFFNTDGTMRTTGNCGFNHIIPYPGHRIDANRRAIPPLDLFGFARSPAYNPAYFNPETVYSPWTNYNNTEYPQASTTATLTDPRNAGPTFNMTVMHRDRTDDTDPGYDTVNSATYNSGTFFPAGIIYARNGACGGLPGTGGANTFQTLGSNVTLNANCTAITLRRPQAGQPGGADELFRVPNGTTLPVGTTYYLLSDNACGGLGAAAPTRRIWVTLPSAVTLNATCEIGIEYFPATFYLPTSVPVPTGYTGANVVATNAGGPSVNLRRYEIRPANYGSTAAYNAAIQNFANWFTYYGDRNRAMIAGMTRSLVEVNNMSVGYFTINQHASRDEPLTKPSERATMYEMSDGSVGGGRNLLFNNIIALPASNSTPNRQAVNAIGQQFRRSDAGAPVKLSCQKNAGMLFTDGYSNQNGPAMSNTDGDGSMGAPFMDAHADTMADIAAFYYKNNIRPDLTSGQVPVPNACPATGNAADLSIDCRRDPHMNFYGVTLGARGNLFNPDVVQNAYTTSAIYNNWPARENDNPTTVDDIWHATVNTRGEFINARTPNDITAAMRRILAAVSDGATPSGTIGVTGARVGLGSLSLQPRYESTNNGTDWYSQLTAETAASNPLTGDVTFAPAWEASAALAAQGEASRTIRFGTTTNNLVPTVSAFTAGNLSFARLCSGPLATSPWCNTAGITALDSGTMNLTRVVAYLRGSRTDEGVLRTRTGILGDIINSSPVLVSATDDYGYRALGGTLATSYGAYLASKKAVDRPLALVGANDGMFHVFDGRAAAPGGNEIYAYVPATSVDHMGNLVFPYVAADRNDQKFKHTYFVDGPIAISDAYIGSTWKTIAVGTSGAGGRSVFALDITDPAAITVLWEVNNLITGNTGVSNNIGHVLGKPVIVPVKDSAGTVSWKVIFGNGYNSAGQQARLFVVDAETGATTTIAAAESTPPAYNGLGNISVIDAKRFDATNTAVSGRDGYSDTVYAADQNGAVWKFDLLSSSVALSGQPLFIARDAANTRQSIMGGLTAAAGPSGGVMLYFGSGSFSFTGDPTIANQQTIYGILDNGTTVSGRAALLQQTYGAAANGLRATSNNPLTAGRRGWYLDLPITERFIGYPRIESGIVFFPTYEANSSSATDCSVGGTNWLYGLNALNGGAAFNGLRQGSPTGTQAASGTGAVALNTGGSAPVRDVGVFTSPRLAPLSSGASQADIDAALAAQCSMVVRVAGAPALYLPRPCGRQSWRQVR